MRKVNVPVMGHLLFLFMTIECSRSVHSIVLRMARVNCATVPFCRTLRADASYFYGIFQKEMVY